MEFSFATSIHDDADAIMVAIEDDRVLRPSARPIYEAAGGAVTRAIATGRFTGKKDQLLDIVAPAGIKADRIVALGVGSQAGLSALDRQ